MAKKAKGNRVQVILECTEHKASGMPGTSRYITTKNRKNNDWKERLNVVYSTNPDFKYENVEKEETKTLDKKQQKLRVNIEKKGRSGKTVTS